MSSEWLSVCDQRRIEPNLFALPEVENQMWSIRCSILLYIGVLETPKDMHEISTTECTLISALD